MLYRRVPKKGDDLSILGFGAMRLPANEEEAKAMYALRMSGVIGGDEPGYASRCVECEEHCPQSLAIPALLKNVEDELEGPDLEERAAMARAFPGVE